MDSNMMFKMDNLILRDLKEEAKVNVKEIQKIFSKTKKDYKNDAKIEEEKEMTYVKKLEKIVQNLEQSLEYFIQSIIQENGVKEIMLLIVDCQRVHAYHLIYTLCHILATLFKWDFAVDNIKSKTEKYIAKFFELGDINDQINRQTIKIIYSCASHLPESFDVILKTAIEQSEKKNTQPFSNLLSRLESEDEK